MSDPAEAKRRWQGQVEEFQQTDSYRELELMENRLSSSGPFSQDLRHRVSSEKSRKTCKNKTLNLKILKIESSSCRCSMILNGREEEIQNNVFQFRTSQKFSQVHGTCLGPGSEKKWCGNQSYPPEGKWQATADQIGERFEMIPETKILKRFVPFKDTLVGKWWRLNCWVTS